jgi:exocyst complex component 4
MVEDASRNPEADSFYYIQLLVESLNKMGRLDVAVDSIEQRLPVELFRVVDKTNNEVDQRHPSSLRGNIRKSKGIIDLGLGDNDIRSTVISDLLWTLYSKFEAIAEGHRVLHDVITGIVKREGVRNSGTLTGGFKELWKLYQSEVCSPTVVYLLLTCFR